MSENPMKPDHITLTMETYAAILDKPLLALPPQVRPAALLFWMSYKHLSGMESAISIASRISIWIDRHGLLPEDAVKILDNMLAPAEMASHEFASQVLAKLACQVTQVIDRRKTVAELRRRQEEEAARRSEVAKNPPRRIREIAAELGHPMPESPAKNQKCF